MSELNFLIDSLPIDRIAAQVGAEPAQARSAIESILPSLVGGLQANAQDPQGAASLQQALGQHAGRAQLLSGDVDPAQIDTEDGAKIAHHIFGSNEGAVNEKLSAASGADKGLIEKLIPVLAPIAMAWIASKFFGSKNHDRTEEPAEFDRSAEASVVPGSTGDDTGVTQPDLGGLLGGLLGGGGQGGGLGDLLGGLGGLLGGGRR